MFAFITFKIKKCDFGIAAKPLCPSICISHGEVLYDGQEPGDLAIFRCDDGYIISGPPKAECQANGTWTVDPPVCISKSDGFSIGRLRFHYDNDNEYENNN